MEYKKLRIAYILSSPGNFGPFIVAKDIISGIRSSADVIDVLYLKESEEKLSFEADHLLKIDFFKSIDLSGYDVIHSHGFLADAYVYYHRRKMPGKTLTTMHQNIKPDYSMAYGGLIGNVLEKIWCHFINRTDKVVCLSKDMVGYYKNKVKPVKLIAVHNGINPLVELTPPSSEQYFDILKLKDNNIVIGVSARLIYRKGIDLIIEALAKSKNQNVVLLIIGDGEKKEELEMLAKNLNISERCFFVGYQKHVYPYFKLMDLYIMSSRSEAFGLCLLEAASLKIPIVCADLPIYRELFQENDVIRFIPEDSSSLSLAIEKAIPIKEQLSNNIYTKYLEEFTVDIMAQKYLTIYNGLINLPKTSNDD